MEYHWLLFCPQLPATPSSPRVTVWRRMRSAGSIGLDNGLWVMPHTEASKAFVREMKEYVDAQGGTSKTFFSNVFDDETEAAILERFRQDRAEEYAEFKEQYADFLAEIDKEVQRKNFSFAELEENEQDLQKLESWFVKVRQRDFLGGDQANEAEKWLQKCRETFQLFAEQDYTNEDTDHESKMKYDPGAVEDQDIK